MKGIQDQITAVYTIYMETRFIKKRSMNMTMSKKEYLDATINEFRQEVNTIVGENVHRIKKHQIPELDEFVFEIVSKFEQAIK